MIQCIAVRPAQAMHVKLFWFNVSSIFNASDTERFIQKLQPSYRCCGAENTGCHDSSQAEVLSEDPSAF